MLTLLSVYLGAVVAVAGRVPILVRGGGRASDEEVLQRTATAIGQGARGIVYGRNVVQHRTPKGMTQSLMGVVHDGLSPAEALRRLQAS
jgi:DhnA family fructose-bisphosphate aldolase class Ia